MVELKNRKKKNTLKWGTSFKKEKIIHFPMQPKQKKEKRERKE